MFSRLSLNNTSMNNTSMNTNTNANTNNNNNRMMMGFSRFQPPMQSIQAQEEIIMPSDGDKMQWGEPTWNLFHTLAEKIIDSEFSGIRSELLNIIYTIVCNLPCPLCSDHGKIYFKSVNFDTIYTKEDLKMMLLNFHNSVNHRKHYAIFTYDELNKKYSNGQLLNIMNHFMYFFSRKSGNIRLLADDLHRQLIIKTIKDFFLRNITLFEK